jgi:phosphate transport system permease protein
MRLRSLSDRPDETLFRAATGAFALLLIAIVAAIGVALYRESLLSIREFGWQFWVSDTWDPVAGEFGARPFIWGTLYSSILALML